MRLKLGTKQEITKDLALKLIKKRELISRFFVFKIHAANHVYCENQHVFHYAALHSTAYHLLFLKQQSNLDKGLPILSGAVA